MSFADTDKPEAQPYKYNGKELDNMNGLNWYDYSARHYDPAIGRFTTIDPLAEKYYNVSPYAYCHNNPINRIDPTGMGDDNTGTPAEEPEYNPDTKQIKGKYTTAQDNTQVTPTPEVKPVKLTEAQQKQLEIQQIRIQAQQNQAQQGNWENTTLRDRQAIINTKMADQSGIGRAYISNPVITAVAAGGLIVTTAVLSATVATALAPEAASVATSGLINVARGGQATAAALGTATTTTQVLSPQAAIFGIANGFFQSTLTYDAPSVSISPVIDLYSTASQLFFTTVKIKQENEK
jgi:RHS repeat-associated protein